MESQKVNLIMIVALIGGLGATIGLQAYTVVQLGNVGGGQQTYTIDISGSTTCYPVISTLAPMFESINPQYHILVGSGGSGGGAEDLANGVVDIAMTSREAKASEDDGTWIDHPFAKDGVSVIVDEDTAAAAGLTNLTLDELWKIYNGTYTNWNEVPSVSNGAYSKAISIGNREDGSGTRDCFESKTIYNATSTKLDADGTGYSASYGGLNTQNGNPQMADWVDGTGDSGRIGYVGKAFVASGHTEIPICKANGTTWSEPISATREDVMTGNYPISRSLHLYTAGTPPGYVQAFIDYVYSPVGQDIVEQKDYIPLYDGNLPSDYFDDQL